MRAMIRTGLKHIIVEGKEHNIDVLTVVEI